MPILKPQHLKSINTINLQPKQINSKIRMIMLMDIAGYKTQEIADELGMTSSRISIIKNTPMYQQQKSHQEALLRDKVIEKKTDSIVGDPIENTIKAHCLEAVKKKISLMREAKSEFVQNAAADSILDRGGYKPHTEKTILSVEVTEKMARRFEEALRYEPHQDARTSEIRIKKEVSS